MKPTHRPPTLPWYRHRWPWILMSGPAIVVVAGIATAVLAIQTDDGVVSDDYYRQGLEINRTLEREQRARDLGVAATVQFDEDITHARVLLASKAAAPRALKLTLIHPTRAGEDEVVALAPVAPGLYEGRLAQPHRGRWDVRLEDAPGTWRLDGTWRTDETRVTLGEASR